MSKKDHEAMMGRKTGTSRMVGPYKRDDLRQLLREGKALPTGLSYSPSSREPFIYIDPDGNVADEDESEGGEEDA
jgi:hypothetical protein